MKLKLKFKPLRSKYWKFGNFYFIPTIIFEWGRKESAYNTQIHLRWLSYQLSMIFVKEIPIVIDIPQELSIEEVERENIKKALTKSGSLEYAAAILGISVRSLRQKIKKYDISL